VACVLVENEMAAVKRIDKSRVAVSAFALTLWHGLVFVCLSVC